MAFAVCMTARSSPQNDLRSAGAGAQLLLQDPVFDVPGCPQKPQLSLDYPRDGVITWLPASWRLAFSLASLPEGGRGKAKKAETQTSAFCCLDTVLVNGWTRGEEDWSGPIPTAIWPISQRFCWLAGLRRGSGSGVVSGLDVASLIRKDGIKSIGHSYVWKSGWPVFYVWLLLEHPG